MIFRENVYGILKRLNFIDEIIREHEPLNVLDVGCGTGNQLTIPLAEKFSGIKFTGVDSDAQSIESAKNSNSLQNLKFACFPDIGSNEKFDLIIASEVIEHVEKPEEFLMHLREKLSDNGKLILTLPNGYGPFEIMSVLNSLLHIFGIYKVIEKLRLYEVTKAVKNFFFGSSEPVLSGKADTLAISPHINFFSYRQICSLIAGTGLSILQYRPRTFLCGLFFDQLLRGELLLNCNAKIADYLPPGLNSDWMFVLERGRSRDSAAYSRGIYARFHRYINEKAVKKFTSELQIN